jgi:ABC-type glycerol-3-phosphate transport system substrate-binding protein
MVDGITHMTTTRPNKGIYIVMIVVIAVAAIAGFLAGQSATTGATQPQTLTIWRTVTHAVTQTYIVTAPETW